MPEPSNRSTAAARAGRSSRRRVPRARSARRRQPRRSNFFGLTTFTRTQAAPNSPIRMSAIAFGEGLEQLQPVLDQQAAQALADHAVVDGVGDAVGVAGARARQRRRARRSPAAAVGAVRVSWMPMTVSPTKPSMKIRSRRLPLRPAAMQARRTGSTTGGCCSKGSPIRIDTHTNAGATGIFSAGVPCRKIWANIGVVGSRCSCSACLPRCAGGPCEPTMQMSAALLDSRTEQETSMALTLRNVALQADRHASHVVDAVRSGFHEQTNDMVMRSWSRCLNEYRLNPDKPREPSVLARVELEERCERHADVIDCARYEMTTLYQQLADSESAVVLTDTDGVIVHMVSSPEFAAEVGAAGLARRRHVERSRSRHQRHGHLPGRRRAGVGAPRGPLLHAVHPAHLLGRAGVRPGRPDRRRARRHQPLQPDAAAPAGAARHDGAHDREPADRPALPRRAPAALSQPARVRLHPARGQAGGGGRRAHPGRQSQRAVPARPEVDGRDSLAPASRTCSRPRWTTCCSAAHRRRSTRWSPTAPTRRCASSRWRAARLRESEATIGGVAARRGRRCSLRTRPASRPPADRTAPAALHLQGPAPGGAARHRAARDRPPHAGAVVRRDRLGQGGLRTRACTTPARMPPALSWPSTARACPKR